MVPVFLCVSQLCSIGSPLTSSSSTYSTGIGAVFETLLDKIAVSLFSVKQDRRRSTTFVDSKGDLLLCSTCSCKASVEHAMKTKFVLAILLVLIPTVYSCVNFGVTFLPPLGDLGGYPTSAMLWDNSAQSDPPTCEYVYSGSVNAAADRYQLDCSDGSTAFWSSSADFPDGGAFAEYYPPGRGYTFATTPETNAGGWQYGACVFGCDSSSCFIPGVTPS